MINQTFPITPPPELVEQWDGHGKSRSDAAQILATKAAQWGWDQRSAAPEAELQQAADQELEACCEWIPKKTPWDAEQLRIARRPKPPSLKEQALEALNQADEGLNESEWQQRSDTIRRALEALPND